MNGDGNMTPFGNDGAGVSPSLLPPVSPCSQFPPLTRYPAGSPHFSPGPRVTTQPLPTFSYLPQTSLSSTSFHNSFPPVHPSAPPSRRDSLPAVCTFVSPSRRDLLPPASPSSSSFRRDSLPPVYRTSSSFRRDSFPHSNPVPRSVTQPAPGFSSLPPSPVYSSLPPLPTSYLPQTSLSSTSFNNSLPPVYRSAAPSHRDSVSRKSLPRMHHTASAQVENTDSPIGFNQNPSPLPPRVPITRSNATRVSGSNTLLPRKSRKRNDGEITGINSTIPPNPPQSSYPPLLGGESSRSNKEADLEGTYDYNAMKEFSNANENRFKTGPTTSGVKRITKGDINPLRQQSKRKPSPTPENLPGNGTQNSTGLTVVTAADQKRAKILLQRRQSAARHRQRQSEQRSTLEHNVNVLEHTYTSMSHHILVIEKDLMMGKHENKIMLIRIESLEQRGKLHDEIRRLKEGTALNGQESEVIAQRIKEETALTEQLCAEIARLKVGAGEVRPNHGQVDGSNMQPLHPNMQSLDPNMFQQRNVNQYNQPQPNHGQFDGSNMEPLHPNMEPLDPNIFQQPTVNQFYKSQPNHGRFDRSNMQPLDPNMFQQPNHGQFNRSNMQPLDPNMFQQPNVNQFNQPQPNNGQFDGSNMQPLDPNMFQQPTVNQFYQLQPNHDQFDESNMQSLDPNMFQQPNVNQLNQPQPNHGQFDGSNMQPLDPNMFQQPNVNQFNQLQPNYGQFGGPNMQPLDSNMFQQPNVNQFNQLQPNHGQFGGSNIQPLDPNMFQQPNVNQFNQSQPQPNFGYDGQK